MKRLHTLFLLLTIAIDIAAQPICQVKHFSVSDGLAQGNVMSILQDQKGLVWFSTWNGLNKFDGYTFKTYKTSQESKYAFGSNRMGTISESKYGDIWCPTYDGQACLFDVETEKFIDVLQPIELSTKQTNNVTRIYSLEKGIPGNPFHAFIRWRKGLPGFSVKADMHSEWTNNYAKKEKASHFIQLPTTT